MEAIKAIDIMNYYKTLAIEKQREGESMEQYTKAREAARGGAPSEHEHTIFATAEEWIQYMDNAGYDKIFFSNIISGTSIDVIYETFLKKFPDRLIGAVGYDPFHIDDSLRTIEKAVKKYNFKYVYFHPGMINQRPNSERMYPCYAKCSELGIPVGMQIGHSAENLNSEVGRPIYLDQVALDFPKLTIIASHTGYPWVEEMVGMAMKHLNVYMDCSAWWPHLWPTWHAPMFRFIDNKIGREKVIFGSNGRGIKLYKDEFLQLGFKEETVRKVLRDNAIKVFKL